MSLIHMKAMVRGATLAAMAAMPALASVAPQQTGQVSATAAPRARTARCIGCDDSTRAKHDLLIIRLDSLRNDFMTRRLSPVDRETVAREMDATFDALRALLESNARSGATATTIVRSGGAGGSAAAGASVGSTNGYTVIIQNTKRGYIGLSLDGPRLGWPPESEQPDVVRYIQYPRIATIDPASPAELAGLKMGDTLVAMNGADVVERQLPLSKWLVPDEKVTLRVRRDGDAKEFRVVVAEAPPYVARRNMAVIPDSMYVSFAPPPAAPRVAEPGRAQVRTQPNQSGQRTPMAPQPGQRFEAPAPNVFMFGSAIYGARIETVNEGLSKVLGVKEGVLVIQAVPSSPAFASGLRDGDIILSAAGKSVANVRDLILILRTRDGDEGVKLVVLRDKKQQDVVLR